MKILFLITGLIPLLGLLGRPPGILFLIYSIFVFFAIWERGNFWRNFGINWPRWLAFFAAALIVGLFSETLAWLDQYIRGFDDPDSILAINYPGIFFSLGYSAGLAAAFLFTLRYFSFSLTEAFVSLGLLGVYMEQDGTVLKSAIQSIFANPAQTPFVFLLLLYTFIIYGSIVGLMYMPVERRYPQSRHKWHKYPIVMALVFFGVKIGTAIPLFIYQLL